MESNKRPDSMARINTPELAQAFIDEQVAALRAQVADKPFALQARSKSSAASAWLSGSPPESVTPPWLCS